MYSYHINLQLNFIYNSVVLPIFKYLFDLTLTKKTLANRIGVNIISISAKNAKVFFA